MREIMEVNEVEIVCDHEGSKKKKLCEYFEEILNGYSAHISRLLSHRTVRRHISVIRQFLFFIVQSGIKDFSKLKSENVKAYVMYAAPKNRASMPILIGAIRKFLSHLVDNGLTYINVELGLVKPAPRHRKLLPCFSGKETDAILNSVDRSNSIGKRDYAIIMLALWTGLRGVDILNLKRFDIDWNRNTINIDQSKTVLSIQTELSPGVGNAIADYILNGRPETDSHYVFVSHRRPHGKLSDGACQGIMARCLCKAGISHEPWDGKSFHALRRTFGTRLVRAGVPLRFVSEMLGHANPDSAKVYIALDIKGLRICCLNISMFRTKKVGLV